MTKIKIRIAGNMGSDLIFGTPGDSLLKMLQKNHAFIAAPCGGKGKCGKCQLHIVNKGDITACTFYPDHDLEIILPGKTQAKILTDQYALSADPLFEPGSDTTKDTKALGVSVDIGTSTLALSLYDLKSGELLMSRGVQNPQQIYGADVITRILHCSEKNGLNELNTILVQGINKVLKEFIGFAHAEAQDIIKLVFSGNTTMLHILAGINPGPLAQAPFSPVFTNRKLLDTTPTGLEVGENASAILLPSLSAYIGADIITGIASLAPPPDVQNYLFLDIGTNGELALVTKGKIITCATAAGPAFEGANISQGMTAITGAISSFKSPTEYETIGNSSPKGICGSGLLDIINYLVKNGIVKGDGYLERSFEVSKGNSSREDIHLTQQDVREVQLAKAAIRAGIEILLNESSLKYADIDAVYLAGGFGNYLSIESATGIGMIPEELKSKVKALGNTSANGASLALKSVHFEKAINDLRDKCTYIELSDYEDFVVYYAMYMDFP